MSSDISAEMEPLVPSSSNTTIIPDSDSDPTQILAQGEIAASPSGIYIAPLPCGVTLGSGQPVAVLLCHLGEGQVGAGTSAYTYIQSQQRGPGTNGLPRPGYQVNSATLAHAAGAGLRLEERVVPLNEPSRIGRAVAKLKPNTTNLVFDCKVLSRTHALLWYENDKFLLQDTKSSNGTYINGDRLSKANEESPPREVYTGDFVQFGVDIAENNKKVMHSCIVAVLHLYHSDGRDCARPPGLPVVQLPPGFGVPPPAPAAIVPQNASPLPKPQNAALRHPPGRPFPPGVGLGPARAMPNAPPGGISWSDQSETIGDEETTKLSQLNQLMSWQFQDLGLYPNLSSMPGGGGPHAPHQQASMTGSVNETAGSPSTGAQGPIMSQSMMQSYQSGGGVGVNVGDMQQPPMHYLPPAAQPKSAAEILHLLRLLQEADLREQTLKVKLMAMQAALESATAACEATWHVTLDEQRFTNRIAQLEDLLNIFIKRYAEENEAEQEASGSGSGSDEQQGQQGAFKRELARLCAAKQAIEEESLRRLRELGEKKAELEAQLTLTRIRAETREAEVNSLECRCKELTEVIEKLSTAREEQVTQISKLETQLKDKETEYLDKLNNADSLRQDLEGRVQELNAQVNDLQEKLNLATKPAAIVGKVSPSAPQIESEAEGLGTPRRVHQVLCPTEETQGDATPELNKANRHMNIARAALEELLDPERGLEKEEKESGQSQSETESPEKPECLGQVLPDERIAIETIESAVELANHHSVSHHMGSQADKMQIEKLAELARRIAVLNTESSQKEISAHLLLGKAIELQMAPEESPVREAQDERETGERTAPCPLLPHEISHNQPRAPSNTSELPLQAPMFEQLVPDRKETSSTQETPPMPLKCDMAAIAQVVSRDSVAQIPSLEGQAPLPHALEQARLQVHKVNDFCMQVSGQSCDQCPILRSQLDELEAKNREFQSRLEQTQLALSRLTELEARYNSLENEYANMSAVRASLDQQTQSLLSDLELLRMKNNNLEARNAELLKGISDVPFATLIPPARSLVPPSLAPELEHNLSPESLVEAPLDSLELLQAERQIENAPPTVQEQVDSAISERAARKVADSDGSSLRAHPELTHLAQLQSDAGAQPGLDQSAFPLQVDEEFELRVALLPLHSAPEQQAQPQPQLSSPPATNASTSASSAQSLMQTNLREELLNAEIHKLREAEQQAQARVLDLEALLKQERMEKQQSKPAVSKDEQEGGAERPSLALPSILSTPPAAREMPTSNASRVRLASYFSCVIVLVALFALFSLVPNNMLPASLTTLLVLLVAFNTWIISRY